jgi:hypothetical protein
LTLRLIFLSAQLKFELQPALLFCQALTFFLFVFIRLRGTDYCDPKRKAETGDCEAEKTRRDHDGPREETSD